MKQLVVVNPALKTQKRQQRTLKKPIAFSGIGIHTGKQVKMSFKPAKEGSGIQFKRVDLSGEPIIPARVEYVCDTARSTTIGVKDVRIHTVEHVLAAVKAYNIDNLIIELDSIEPPVGNGSSDVFVDMIEQAGHQEQSATVPIVQIQKPVYFSEGDIHIVALPYEGYKFSYTLNYPNHPMLDAQYYTSHIDSEIFKTQIAPCRTFSLYEEISHLIDRGLVKGASLDNAVVIKDKTVFSKNGLFFPNEMARHKMLDMIGDLSLVGFDFQAHIISVRSGHPANFAFAKKLYHYMTMETT